MREKEMEKQRMRRSRRWLILTVLLLCMLWIPVRAGAAYQNQWVTDAKGKTYYYNGSGQKVKGQNQIGGKYYYFDSNGVQRTGWIQIGKAYYYFNIDTQKNGYRVSSKKINGVTLASDGKAKKTSYSKRKLKILVKANKIIWKFCNDNMTKKEKLKKAFEYTKKHLRSYNMGSFRKGKNWDLTYAEIVFKRNRADCYGYGVYFAYLANAIGYKASAVSSGGHGWAEINRQIFDANWAKVDKRHNYFNMNPKLSGKDGRPNYAKYRKYVKTI